VSLSSFSPRVRTWFEAAFAAPTPAQAKAWPAIAKGEHVLLSAPTGSGKTLAAFLWALDRLSAAAAKGEPRGTRVVYVSPLKALAYDIERNLRAPLRGIGAAEEVRVGIRTGDTPQRERAAMVRRPPDILVTTPESLYLILTSEARKMLTGVEAVIVDEIHAVAHSKRGAHLALTLERLEDLRARAAQPGAPPGATLPGATPPDPTLPGATVPGTASPKEIQRIGLSATQNPLEEIGRFLVGPRRKVTIVDAGVRKQLDLRIELPVESLAEPGNAPAGAEPDPLDPIAGGESTRGSIWPAIYPELLKLIEAHRSTIVFVNNRRSAERVALRLNELANRELARAHHGSLAREERSKVEELLKAGELPCLVATSSLELGIDMGAVDLVIQIESPKSVARGLQRIGRAGHGVHEVSRGRIFPKFSGDLLECAVVARRMREGAIEPTVVPRNALDVLAQQIVAIAAAAQSATASAVSAPPPSPHGDGAPRAEAPAAGAVSRDDPPAGVVSVDDLHALVTRTHSYAELSKELLENVLDMLDGRYPSKEFGELRARIVWDRLAGTIRARRGARQLAIANAGTIPDRGLYAVTLPDGRRVGELDEEMVYEARPGQAFLLGASTWRIEEIGRDRVIVTPAPGAPGAVPFWKGDAVGRPKELGEAIGAFARWAVGQEPETLQREYDLDARAARNLSEYLREQQAATRVLPSDRTIVLERFRDEIGDWRLCLLSPYGGRVHAAWGLALSARVRERFGLEADAIWSDDGIVLHLPDLDGADRDGDGYDGKAPDGKAPDGEGPDALPGGDDPNAPSPSGPDALPSAAELDALPSLAELVLLEPDEVQAAVQAELGGSALFGARFRENAARALLIPRAYPGKRTPLWQQRLKAQSLLEVAQRFTDFPIVLETYRECLRDVLDVAGLQELLGALQRRELALVEVETPTASPFARTLLFDYVATYMYEGDAPNAERRAAALSLDRDLLRELLGQEELRELIDPRALERVEDELQCRSELTQATGRDELHDVLRRVGDLTRGEVAERVLASLDADALLDGLVRERRAIAVRVGGEERFIAAEEAGLYRDALGVVPPGGLPAAFLEDVEEALRALIARYARTRGPFSAGEPQARYGVDAGAVLRELERSGTLVRGELRPGGAEREWCDVEVLRRLRRASLAALRKEIEPTAPRALARFLPAWQGVDRHPAAGAGVDRLREVLVPLQGLPLPSEIWERDVLPRRVGAYSPAWLDSLCASGELVWVGAGARALSGRVALYFREDAPLIGPPPIGRGASPPGGAEHELLRARLAAGPCFFGDLLAELALPAEALREALWDLVWAGEATNDAWAPLRAPHLTLARARTSDSERAGPGRAGPGRAPQPGGLRVPQPGGLRARSRFGVRRRGAQARVQGRWSPTAPLFHAAPADSAPPPQAVRRARAELLLERYGIVTREQVLAEGIEGGFAGLYESFSRLETLGACRRGYFLEGLGGAQFALPGAVERLRERAQERTLVLAAADPAQPYGATLPWPKRKGQERSPARVAGAYVVLVAEEPVLYLERGGRGLVTLIDAGRAAVLERALGALAEAVRAGRVGKLALERIDGAPAIGSELERVLVGLGFHSGPRRLSLSA
jgi:ATP-dependent Lhr-like helicase